jgi:hypothetical protein
LVLPPPQLLELDRGQVTKRAVETFMIVFTSPVLKEHLGFEE